MLSFSQTEMEAFQWQRWSLSSHSFSFRALEWGHLEMCLNAVIMMKSIKGRWVFVFLKWVGGRTGLSTRAEYKVQVREQRGEY